MKKIFLFIALLNIAYAYNDTNSTINNQCISNDINISLNKKEKLLLCKEENKEGGENKKAYLSFQDKFYYIDTYYPEGGNAKTELAFIKNSNDKHKKELIVLISWEQRIKETAEGKLYQVYVYHMTKKNKLIKKLDDIFKVEFDGWQEGETSIAKFISEKSIKKRLNLLTNLTNIEKVLKNKKINTINLDIINEIIFCNPLTPKTLTQYNNIAYYLQKAGANKEAVYLLEKIIKKFPNRTVAYYNLADAYWELGEKNKAIKAYTTYIEQMCHKGLQKKIPKQVLQRVERKNACK